MLRSVGGRGPLAKSAAAAALNDPNWVLSECRHFSASLSGAKQFVMKLGSFVMNMLQTLDASAVAHVVNDVADFYVSPTHVVCRKRCQYCC